MLKVLPNGPQKETQILFKSTKTHILATSAVKRHLRASKSLPGGGHRLKIHQKSIKKGIPKERILLVHNPKRIFLNIDKLFI